MARFSSVAIALAAAVSMGTSAFAAGIYFQTVPTTATDICLAPCFNVQMFAQDDSPGGTRVIQAIQFDVNVAHSDGSVITSDFVSGAALPVPPLTSTNAGVGNTTITDDTDPEAPSQVVIPFELSATVGKSPKVDQDALIVVASAFPHSVAEVLAARHLGDSNFSCSPAAACSTQAAGLALNRIYL